MKIVFGQRFPALFVKTSFLTSLLISSCGQNQIQSRSELNSNNSSGSNVELKKHPSESVEESVTLNLAGSSEGLGLSQTLSWKVDMEQRKDVTSSIAAKKYLRVTGDLKSITADIEGEIGCLQVELRDNVNYREEGWLRVATNGIFGATYREIKVPISIMQNGWTNLPILEDSVTLGKFAKNTVKKFDGNICFKMDLRDLPAQSYKGQIIVQYLKSGVEQPDGDTPVLGTFACAKDPVVIKAGESTKVSFKRPSQIEFLNYSVRELAGVPNLGTISIDQDVQDQVTYKSPADAQKSFKAIIEAKPSSNKYLPVFCEVHVLGKDDIGVGDDGEIIGLPGNVYKLATNTSRLPDFSKLSAVAAIAVPNLDIPERAFSAGFPGVKDLFEWFGIQFRGTIIIPQRNNSNPIKFRLTADDGANLYINNTKVVDNDGVHPTTSRDGSASLAKGQHDIKVEYFQGPRHHITLQLLWDLGDGQGFQIIPSTAFTRPLR
jgi:hypothetical protein